MVLARLQYFLYRSEAVRVFLHFHYLSLGAHRGRSASLHFYFRNYLRGRFGFHTTSGSRLSFLF